MLYSQGVPQSHKHIDILQQKIHENEFYVFGLDLRNKLIHFPELIYLTKKKKKTQKSKRLCLLCKVPTLFYCKECSDGINISCLCLPCFEIYHKRLFD